MKIQNARGKLAKFVADHKPKIESVRGEALAPILEAAGYEIVQIKVLSKPKGLLQKQTSKTVPGIEKNGDRYSLDQLRLEIWWWNEFVDDDGNLAIVPHAHLSATVPSVLGVGTQIVNWGNTNLAEKAGYKTVRFPLPEKVILMPAPSWVEATADDQSWVVETMWFESEAHRQATEFRAKLESLGL